MTRFNWLASALAFSLAVTWIAAPGPTQAAPSQTACSALTASFKVTLKTKKKRKRARSGKPAVLSATWHAAAPGLPEHCAVSGLAYTGDKAVGVNEVQFRLELPTSWNSKLHFQGNSGYAGSMRGVAQGPAAAGYATAVTDTGHQGSSTDASWAAASAPKRIDFLDRGVHRVTVGVKQVIARYYGSAPLRAYFEGCSTGGRQGLWEAMRYPADFDGVIAGAPADFEVTMASLAWNQRFMFPDPTRLGTPALAPSKLATLDQHVLAACDALDGISDDILDDPRECTLDPTRDLPVCAPGNGGDPACFTPNEIAVIDAIFRGPGGVHRAPGYSKGGHRDTNNWRHWMVSSSNANPGPNQQHLMVDAFFRNFANPPIDFRSFDPANGAFTLREPAGFAANGDLRAFQQRGGKLILWHGWWDAAIPPLSSVNAFEAIANQVGAATRDDFARLYMAPGVYHCSGGRGPDNFDALGALERWVESGQRPDGIVASGAGMTRPLCPYPQRARLINPNGSTTNANNFRCQ